MRYFTLITAVSLTLIVAACQSPTTSAKWETVPAAKTVVSVSPGGGAISTLFEGWRITNTQSSQDDKMTGRGTIHALYVESDDQPVGIDIRGGGTVPPDARVTGRVMIDGRILHTGPVEMHDGDWLIQVSTTGGFFRNKSGSQFVVEIAAEGLGQNEFLIDIDSIDIGPAADS